MLFIGISIIGVLYYFSLPSGRFIKPISTVMYDRNGELIGACIASDGQWRFPSQSHLPEKYIHALLCFEDQYFYYHPGINPVSLIKAAYKNIKEGKIESGASTISMQLIRISGGQSKRNIWNKIKEIFLAFRLESIYPKSAILRMYASIAPFGGNTSGIEAASWRYFGRNPNELSWAEAATLAVLPNSPSLIHPGRNREFLLKKRNRLLTKLYKKGHFDKVTLDLAISEPLPEKPFPVPQISMHLFNRAKNEGFEGQMINSTIDAQLQKKVITLALQHNKQLKSNDINNLAVLVVRINTGEVIAYLGNAPDNSTPANYVDIITSRRSPGSILKPFLYAAMLNEGLLLPNTLVADIPTQYGGYAPENFYRTYDGAIPASAALARSLNVPAVRMLKDYSAEKFNYILKKIGIRSLDKPASHYGLSIILGGAETSLWDLCGAYASFGRTLNHYQENYQKFIHPTFFPLNYSLEKREPLKENPSYIPPISPAAIYFTLQAMMEVTRPDEELYWQMFSSSSPIAWKTGTSFGYRDGWAIGFSPDILVGVWVGNASGEGRPGLTGVATAAPLMFDVFKLFPKSQPFLPPYQDMERIAICRISGHRAGPYCEPIDTVWIPVQGLRSKICPYHKRIHLDSTETYQVNSSCYPTSSMHHANWFVLPPVWEYFFKNKNAFYKIIPPLMPSCSETAASSKSLGIIYPQHNSKIFVPVMIDGKPGQIILKATHQNPKAQLHWHLNDNYIGSTTVFHEMAISPAKGEYRLTIVDNEGEILTRLFSVTDNPKHKE